MTWIASYVYDVTHR